MSEVEIREADLARQILRAHEDERARFGEWSGAQGGAGEFDGMGADQQLRLIGQYLDRLDAVAVAAGPDDEAGAGELEFRLAAGRVVHLREALKTLLIDGLGLFFAFATTSGIGALFYGWFFISGVDLVRRFMRCFEKIDDPQERLVFETLYELQNRRAARASQADADAPEAEKIARLSAGAADIADALAPQMSAEEVRSVLRGLAARDIVKEHDGLWSISFW